MGSIIKLTASDGVTIDAYRAEPAGTSRGGIVVLQEIFGINAHIRSVADRYAAQGYLAVAPALFDRVTPGLELGYDQDGMTTGIATQKQTKPDDTLKDVAAAIAEAAKAGKVGIVGFCWGGTLAYAAAGPARRRRGRGRLLWRRYRLHARCQAEGACDAAFRRKG